MDSASSSSANNPSLLFTCSMNPKLPDCPYDLSELNRQRKLIDIHVKMGDKRHPAHRQVLSSSSPVLEAMLSENWDPEKKDVCELGEDVVDPQIADDLIDFLYIREITITMQNAKQLCIAANYLELSTLKAGADRFLTDHLRFSTDDIFDWLNFTEMHQIECLRKSCIKFVFENYRTVLKMEELLTFSEDFLMQLLVDLKEFESSIVNRAMFELLIKWIKFDITTRSSSLLNFLKFPFLEVSEKFITEAVLKEEIITNSSACRELVNDSLKELSSLLKAKHLYCISHRQSVYHLDISAGKWSKMSPRMHERYSTFCSAAIGDKIYIFGGGSNIVEVLDTKYDHWTELPSMPVSRYNAAAVALNGYIYVSGGYGEGSMRLLRSVYRYCIATKEWSSVTPMLKARTSHTMVPFNDSIFAIGGHYKGGKKTVEKYSPEANQWEMVHAFELRDEDFTVLHKDKFYAFNLRRPIDNVDTYRQRCTVHVYDPLTSSTETFQDSSAVEVLGADNYPACVSVGDKIFALGNRFGIFGEFDPVTRKWKKMDIDMSVLGGVYEVVVLQR